MRREILLILVLFVTEVGFAQGPQRLITFDEALNLTLGQNPDLEAIKYETKAVDFERKAAIGLRMPKLGVAGNYTHLGENVHIDYNEFKPEAKGIFDELAPMLPPLSQEMLQKVGETFAKDWGEYTIQDRDFGFIGVNATIPIYMGGKINVANRVAKINHANVIKKGDQEVNSLITELVERYYGLVLSNQVVSVRKQVVAGVRLHLHDAIQLETNGMIAKGERLFVEVKMAEAERDLRTAILDVNTIHSAMCNTMNEKNQFLPISTMFLLDSIADLRYFQDLAMKHNPILVQVALKRDLANEGVKLKRSAYFPEIVAVGGYNVYEYQLSSLVPQWGIGVGIKLNLFDGLNREFKHSAAKQTLKQVDAIEQSAKNDVLIMVEKLYNQLVMYSDQMPSIMTSIEFAEEYLRIKREAFKEGLASSSDVVDAELNLAKIRIENVKTAYLYDVALAKLLEISGISEAFSLCANGQSANKIIF